MGQNFYLNFLYEQYKGVGDIVEKRTTCLKCNKQLTKKQIGKRNMFCSKGCATSYRQTAHDPDIFQIKDKDILYYLLGLIFTDGNLNKEENRITLSLTQKDIITFLYPYFCDTNKRKIYEYQPKGSVNYNKMYTIINSNADVIQQMKLLSFTPHNSTTKTFPNINKEYLPAFLRGVFDGDGCVILDRQKYKRITIACASDFFVQCLLSVLENFSLSPTLVVDSRRKNNLIKTYYVCLNKQSEIKRFAEIIYKDAKIFIKYKKDKMIA